MITYINNYKTPRRIQTNKTVDNFIILLLRHCILQL